MRDRKKKYTTYKICIITFVWAFPYMIGAVPFFWFFNFDRTEWLRENGLNGYDFNEGS